MKKWCKRLILPIQITLQTSRKIFFIARKKQAAQSLFKTPKDLTFTHYVKLNWKPSKPTSAVSKNIILMITTKLFCLFTRSARLFVAKRSSKLFYDVIIRVLKNQLGAVYARASSMFLLFILEFYFCCYLSFFYLCIQLSIIWYKCCWFWFLSLYITHAFHVNNIYL